MTQDELIAAISNDALRETTVATITYSLRLDPSGSDLRRVIARDVAEKFPVFFPEFAKALRKTGALAGLGITEQQGVQTGVAVAAMAAIAIPVVGPIISGLIGLFGSMFGGDGELGPVTPGVVNPETGEGVHCNKPDEVARTQLLAQGNISWFRGRYGTKIGPIGEAGVDITKYPFPEPSGVNRDLQIDANFYFYLAQAHPGQCPSMTSVCRKWLEINLPKLQPSMSAGLMSSVGPIAAVGAAAWFVLPKIFGGRKRTRRNPVEVN